MRADRLRTDHRARLARIQSFPQLVAYLHRELDWPIDSADFEELTFDYTPGELGIDAKNAAKIQEIKSLRPLVVSQPWGVFYVKFEPKRLPVVALRRILGSLTLKTRASANPANRQAWAADDLLFVSSYGEDDERRIAFAHFSTPKDGRDLPTLKVLGWDNKDTDLHLDAVARELRDHLTWPDDESDTGAWCERWRGAFTLRHREVITTSKQLSERLAELARGIRDRARTALEIESESGPLTRLMGAFRTALVHDLDKPGFADMYAQTIAYGLLSARITDPERRTADDLAAHVRTSPFLRDLMGTFLRAGGRRGAAGGPGIDFDELGVSEVVELLDAANMEAVVLDFGDRNPQEDPVIHFYERFLAAYDPEKKKKRGVFYTPRPVVSYIVRSVDELLRSEFGLEDGLADTTTWGEMVQRYAELTIPDGITPERAFVQILDPATGTGTFLVEVIGLIHKTMVRKWEAQRHDETQMRALWNEYVPNCLLPRLYGYELLMAPYAIAHLKVSLKLYETGYRFESDERAQVYLTNALEPASDEQPKLDFAPALADEAQAVNAVKRKQRFTVVIGNPPYSGHSRNNQVPWIVEKVYDYKRNIPGLQKPGQAKWLQDDYVKFIRMVECEIEQSSSGVLGFITNHAWLDNPTFEGMRKHLLGSFDIRRILDLHGNANKQESMRDGKADENVFGEIKQGVAVSLLARTPAPVFDERWLLRRGDVFGASSSKFSVLLENTMSSLVSAEFKTLPPEYIFDIRDEERKVEYQNFSSLSSIFGQIGRPTPGIVTTHDKFAISFTREEQVEKVEALLATRNEEDARRLFTLCSQGQWNYDRAKKELSTEKWRNYILPVLYRPFDVRFTVYDRNVSVHRRERVSKHMRNGLNVGIVTCRQRSVRDTWCQVFGTTHLIESSAISNKTKEIGYLFPLRLYRSMDDKPRYNIDTTVLSAINELTGLEYLDRDPAHRIWWNGCGDLYTEYGPRDVFDWVYAVLHSHSYRTRYADFLRSDFARVPLPGQLDLFRGLAEAGHQLLALHLLESPQLDDLITTYTGSTNPVVGRAGWSDGTVWLDAGKPNARTGYRATRPGTIGFHGVPKEVWDFQIGSYRVCYKWLYDRRGRTLSDADILHYQKIVVALHETIRIMAEIDEVIEAHGGWPGAFLAGADVVAAPEGPAKVAPFRPATVEPAREDRYVTCVPLVPLRAAAGWFSDPQHVEEGGDFEWVSVKSRHRLRRGMFVAQVAGRSMEPRIRDGSWCLFRASVEGTRQGKIVLVELRDATDPETDQRYTVKRYTSQKATTADSWRHERITLRPLNPDFEPIVIDDAEEDELRVVAEFVEVLTG